MNHMDHSFSYRGKLNPYYAELVIHVIQKERKSESFKVNYHFKGRRNCKKLQTPRNRKIASRL